MMPPMPSKKMGMPPQADMGDPEEQVEAGSTQLPIASYPDLKDAQEGERVTIEGTVQSNDGESVSISYDAVNLQVNQADKAVRQMTGKKSPPQQSQSADNEE